MITNNPEISVVIPMYNCEKFIRNCLMSLKAQTYQNFEVIIVDNGSTDSSAEEAEKICRTDERFSLIKSSSGKAGSARNAGIERSRGNYIAFVDGDDTVKEKYLEEMYRAAVENNADIAVCGFWFYFLNTGKIVIGDNPPKFHVYDRIEALKELLRDKTMRFYLWNKLWKRSLFTENNIKIPDMYYEDAVVCPRLFCNAEKVVTVDYCGYVYMRAFSKYKEIRMTKERINNYINTVPMIRLCLEEQNIYKQVKSSFRTHIFHVFFALPSLVIQAKEELKNGVLKNMVSGMAKVIKYSTMPTEELKTFQINNDTVQ
ncbi:MAG: glycosyltransferase family 2 protein [Clostridia bacterium]|nr:glycosyltransferase family 2 protein [Clostridia bacterium]